MLCDECKERPATVHVTQIINDQKSEVHLCEVCAKAKGHLGFAFKPSFSVQDLLAGLIQQFSEEPELPIDMSFRVSDKCEVCGMTLEDFRRTGRLGCGRCYDEFREQLEPLLRRLHGSSKHIGKLPRRVGGIAHLKRLEGQLKKELQKAIASEKYEKAAELRDKIHQLEKDIKRGEVS